MATSDSPTAGASSPPAQGGGRAVLWLAGVILVSLLVRAPGLKLPLDQDGAVFCYAATQWAGGGLPYRDAWDHKSPLIYLTYMGLFALSPATPATVNTTLRVGSAACDIVTLLLLFFLVRRFFGSGAGVVAALGYGLFTGAVGLQLEALQPERLTVMLCTAGVLAAAAYADSRRCVYAALSGLLFGLGMIAKQIAAPVGLLAWLWVTWDALRAGGRAALGRVAVHSLLMAGGVVLPWAACAGYFASQGAFGDFWTCTYEYNVFYATEHRKGLLAEGLRKMWETKVYDHAFLWLTAFAGVVLALARPRERRGGLLVLGWILAAFLALFLPGQFAYYYYIPTVAPLAAASAVALVGLWRLARGSLPLPARVVLAGVPALALLGMLGFAAKRAYGQFQDHTSPKSANVVIAEVAKYLAERTKPEDRLYMWGGRPQVYVLSGRRSVCRYLYNFYYGLPQDKAYHYRPEKRKEIIAALAKYQPPYIVVIVEIGKGGKEKDPFEMFPELREYMAEHYEPTPEKEWPAEAWAPRVYTRKAAP